VDRRRFDADPDLDLTYRFDADPHPDPTYHFDADPNPDPPDPTPGFTHVGTS
jgi:hypothetical protein